MGKSQDENKRRVGRGGRGTHGRNARLGQDDWQAGMSATASAGGTRMSGTRAQSSAAAPAGASAAHARSAGPSTGTNATTLPDAQGTDPFGQSVATPAERAMVRRIGAKAAAWSAVFVILLAAAALAWGPASVGSPAQVRGVLHLPAYAYRWAIAYPWLAAAYPWLAGAAFVTLIVAVTYLAGWTRAAGVIRDAEAGDRIAFTYLKEGPRLGSIEWWWMSPPVRPRSEGRKVTLFGVVMAFAALAFIALAVLIIMLGWGRPCGRALGAAFPTSMLLSAVPMVAFSAWCFAFTARPSAGKVRAAGVMRWVLFGVGLLGLGGIWWLDSHGIGPWMGVGISALAGLGAIVVAAYGMMLRFIVAARALATIALDHYVTVPTPRRRIDVELRRMGEGERQQPFDGTNSTAERVNRRRERRLALRVTAYVIVFVVLVAVGSWVKVRSGA